MTDRLIVHYKIRAEAHAIDARAHAVAVEQSVEMPVAAIRQRRIVEQIVGEVRAVRKAGEGAFEVDIALACATFGGDAGQLVNMLFGNSSLQDDVALLDFTLPGDALAAFDGPGLGIAGLRALALAPTRALTCAALKPQGLPPEDLAQLAGAFASGGVDVIKDDHGLADQAYSPFEARVRACVAAIHAAARSTGRASLYAPSLCGHYGDMRRQIDFARAEGVRALLVAPFIAGFSTVQALRRENPDLAFLAHPTLAGAARISPVAMARLFRLIGADATIFPNHGGRFGYSPATCLQLADALRRPFGDKRASLPTPAGGMTPARAPEILDFYGPDVMLLIGGALLAAPLERLADEAAAFARAVASHQFGDKR